MTSFFMSLKFGTYYCIFQKKREKMANKYNQKKSSNVYVANKIVEKKDQI